MLPKIYIYTGPMFAGKTTYLIKNWNDDKTEIKLAFKYAQDDRYENEQQLGQKREIVSHNNTVLPAFGIARCTDINIYIPEDEPSVSIYIDEGQFFPDIKHWILDLAPKNVKKIYISGLDFDIFGNHFNTEFADLMKLSEECHTLTSKCYICQQPAFYTQFIDNNSVGKLSGNILIGGAEQYQPACHTHFKPMGS